MPLTQKDFEDKYGQVWTTEELRNEFIVEGFLAPFVLVIRKSDNVKGTMTFSHMPRYYYDFREEVSK
jgi:hypothetical protein